MAFGKLIRKFKKRRKRRQKALKKLARRLSPPKSIRKKIAKKIKPPKKIRQKARSLFGGKRRKQRKRLQQIRKKQQALIQRKKQGKPTVAPKPAKRRRRGFFSKPRKKVEIPKSRTGKKLTPAQKLKARLNRDRKRLKLMDFVNPKNKVLPQQPGEERIERAKESVRQKVNEHRKKQGQDPLEDETLDIPTSPNEEDIMAVIMSNVGDEFEKNGKVAVPYKGTIEEILSATTIKAEQVFTEGQLDPALWKEFEVNVPTKEFVEIPGTENLEKDLKIGELNWIKADLEDEIKEINVQTSELLAAIAKFFGLNNFLTGSIEDWELRQEDAAETINMIEQKITEAGATYQQLYSEYEAFKAIHNNVNGCVNPGDPEGANFTFVIPVYEFYNITTGDYAYSTNFEWNLDQDPGIGFMKRRVHKGLILKPQMLTWGGTVNNFPIMDTAVVNFNKVGDGGGGIVYDWWGGAAPGDGPIDKFTTTYEGYISFPQPGRYEVSLQADDTGLLELQQKDGVWIRVVDIDWGHHNAHRYERYEADDKGKMAYRRSDKATWKVTQEDIDDDVRYGLRFMQSENGGHAYVGLKWRNLDSSDATKKKYKWRIRKWLRWRWLWKRSWAFESYNVANWKWIPAEYVSLAAPGNYKFNRIAFGAYDPLEATHKKAKGAKTISKFSSTKSVPEAHDDAKYPSLAMEACGNHYMSIDGKPPTGLKTLPDKDWGAIPSDFAVVNAEHNKPHPQQVVKYYDPTEKRDVIVEDGLVKPVHMFVNQELGTHRYMIIPDGRTIQERNAQGEVQFENKTFRYEEIENGNVREKQETIKIPKAIETEEKQNTEFVEELAGLYNTVARRENSSGRLELPPAAALGQGYEWKGIVFWAYEPPPLPPNAEPFVQIYDTHDMSKPYNIVQKQLKWNQFESGVKLQAKAKDPDGRIVSTVWKIKSQRTGIAWLKNIKKGTVLGYENTINYKFPIGKTVVTCTVTDNRDGQTTDEITVNMIPPSKNKWVKISSPTQYKDYSGGKYVASYEIRTQKPSVFRRTKYGTRHYDYTPAAYNIYEQGYQDALDGQRMATRDEIVNQSKPRSRQVEYRDVIGHNRRRRFHKRRRTTPIYGPVKYRTEHYTDKVKEHFAASLMSGDRARNFKYTQAQLFDLAYQAYVEGYYHAQYPNYLSRTEPPKSLWDSYDTNRKLELGPRVGRNNKVFDWIKRYAQDPQNVKPYTPNLWSKRKARKIKSAASQRVARFFRKRFPSDIRLKENINLVGNENGINLYEYNYIWDESQKYRGVMAQELLETKYKDFVDIEDDYYVVDYTKLPVEIEKL